MRATIDRVCPNCGKTYAASVVRLKHGRETTCSRECSYVLRGTNLFSSTVTACAVCEKPITSAPSRAARRRHGSAFCSRACHYAGRGIGATKRVVTEPYEIGPEARAALSTAAALSYASGNRMPFPKAEIEVRERLAALGVEFVHQFVFGWDRGAFCVDFYFPDRRLVVEIDGESHRDAEQAARDADRDAWLARSGIRTVRVPDSNAVERVVALVA